MKHLFLASLLFVSMNGFAQSVPQGITYQAAARNSSGGILASQNVSVEIQVHAGSSTGTVVYSETFALTTDQYGLFALTVGAGTPVIGAFSGIDWSAQNFVQVGLDPTGGSTYVNMGTTPLNSVPYALFAQNGFSQKVAFSVLGSGLGQSLTYANTALTWSSKDYDITDGSGSNNFDLGSNTFTAPSAGLYAFSASVDFSAGSAESMILLSLFKNGLVQIPRFSKCQGAAGANLACVLPAAPILLNAGDTISLGVYSISVNSGTFVNGAGANGSWFNGYKIY